MQALLAPIRNAGAAWPALRRFSLSVGEVGVGADAHRGAGEAAQHGPVADAGPKKTQRVYVKKLGQSSCTECLMLGLIAHFRRVYPHVGFFKPVGTDPYRDGLPRNVVLMHEVFKMDGPPAQMFALMEDAALQMMAQRKHKELQELCYNRLSEYEAAGHDLVVINGWRTGGLVFNAELARYLDAPLLLSVDYSRDDTPESCYDRAMAEVEEYRQQKNDVLGLVLNDVEPSQLDVVHQHMQTHLQANDINYLGTIPKSSIMDSVTLDQIFRALSGHLLFTPLDHVRLGEPVGAVYPVTSHAGFMLARLAEMPPRPLLLTTQDRIDTIVTAFAAHAAGVTPLAGIAITGHSGVASPYRGVLHSVVEGLGRSERSRAGASKQWRLPIFTTGMTVYDAVKTVQDMAPDVLPTSDAKIEAAVHAFDEHIDTSTLMAGFERTAHRLTPARFLHSVRQQCRTSPQRIVLPESQDHRILRAAAAVQQRGLAKVVLLGNREMVEQEFARVGVHGTGIEVLDPEDPRCAERYVNALVQARKHKNISAGQAADLLKDPNYFGTMMVHSGDADGMVSGAAHTTAATVRPAMQVLKDKAMPLVSSVFFMCLPDKVLVYGDCAINVDPDSSALAYIAIASADTAAAFGIEPRVAMLSYSTMGSGSGPQVEKVERAVEIARELRPDLKVAGPMQYDAATSERVAAVKVKGDGMGVAGRASVLVFPDLNTGNNTYKAVQLATDALALGPLLQGLAGAVNDLSRGCTVEDVIDTICATSVQAQVKKQRR